MSLREKKSGTGVPRKINYKGFIGNNAFSPMVLIISGPSGVGKGTLVEYLQKKYRFSFVVSYTTRAPREGEREGDHYHFVTEKQFRQLMDEGFFLETCEVHPGKIYGTPLDSVNQLIKNGKCLLLDIEPIGAMNAKKILGDKALTVLIEPPSIKELERRLRSRGTETEDQIRTRLDRVKFELGFKPLFDFSLVNDKLDKTYQEMDILLKKRMFRLRHK